MYIVFFALRVTIYISVPSVPLEAVNMSLGLSLTAATNPFQLLVSYLESQEHPEGRSWGNLGLVEPGGFMGHGGARMGGWDKSRGSSSHQHPSVPRPAAPLCTTHAGRTYT